MFNICRSNPRSGEITGLMTSCAGLWNLTCVHTVEILNRHRGWRSCCPGLDVPTCVLSWLLLLSLRNVWNPAWKAPGMLPWNMETHSSPLTGTTSSPTCFPCSAHPKNNCCYSGRALNLQEKGGLLPNHWQSPPARHWLPAFIFLGRSRSDYSVEVFAVVSYDV